MDSEDFYSDEYYDDYDSEYDYSYDDELDELDSEEDAFAGLDYYYDDDGFAHPVRPKGKFGYDRYRDAYNYHLDPQRNENYSSDEEEDAGYSSYSDNSEEEY